MADCWRKILYSGETAYNRGKCFIVKIDYSTPSYDCSFRYKSKRIVRPTIRFVPKSKPETIAVVYDEYNDTCLLLRSSDNGQTDVDGDAIEKEDILIGNLADDIKAHNGFRMQSLSGIIGSDKRNNHTKPSLIVLTVLLSVMLLFLVALNFELVPIMQSGLRVALNVVIGVMGFLLVGGLIYNIVSYFNFLKIKKGAVMILAKLIKFDRHDEVHESEDGSYSYTLFAVEYEFDFGGTIKNGKSFFSYNEENLKQLKKNKYFPVLYNLKLDRSIFFKPGFCTYLSKYSNLKVVENEKEAQPAKYPALPILITFAVIVFYLRGAIEFCLIFKNGRAVKRFWEQCRRQAKHLIC